MAFERDIYYQALYERLRAKVPGIVTWSRRNLHFAKVPQAAHPVCCLIAANQDSSQEEGVPRVWTLGADVVIAVRSNGLEESLDTVLNGLVDAVEAALVRDPSEPQVGPFQQTDPRQTTLGGLVHVLRIAGPVEFDQREGGDHAFVVIPIDMVVLGDW